MRVARLPLVLLTFTLSVTPARFLSAQQPAPVPVAGDLQRWADVTGDGRLDAREAETLAAAMVSLLVGPHPGRTPLDGMFDANHDGTIGQEEVDQARMDFFKAQLLRSPALDPGLARFLDLNNDGRVDDVEAQQMVVYLFVDEKVRQNHLATSPVDKKADLNGDGKTGGDEFAAFRLTVVKGVALLPGGPAGAPAAGMATGPGAVPVPGEFQKWADLNGDGMLDARETETLAAATIDLLTGPHPGRTPLDAAFDADRNGTIGPDELARARVEFFKVQLVRLPELNPELARLVDLNNDGRVGDMEAQQAIDYLFLDEKVRGPHPVTSPVDRKADLNGDGRTGGDEFFMYRMQVVRAVALLPWNIAGPRVETTIVQQAPTTTGESSEPAASPAAGTASETAAATTTAAAASSGAAVAATTATAKPAEVKLSFSSSIDQIFPIFLKWYDTNPIGKATVKNAGTVAMESVKVQLIVKEYMTDKKLCATIDSLAAGEQQEVSLFAVFTKAVLDISEQTKAQANISVEYTASGQTKTEEFVSTVSFLNRNNMTWDDNKRVAAFVTKNDSVVLLVRSAAVTVVDTGSTAVDKYLRAAIAIHETLSLYGIKYWADPKGSYETTSQSKTSVDYLQLPAQTLQQKTGDCDDLSMLWSALLEASSIDSAFVTVPGHIFVALALDMTPEEARKSAMAQEDLIYAKDKVWVPVEVTSIKDGFLKAWQAGAKEYREASQKSLAGFDTFEEASAKFAPVGFSASTASLSMPTEAAIAAGYKADLKKIVDREIALQLASIQAEIAKTKDKPDPLNKLGVLYARYGLTEQAAAQFQAALKINAVYVPSLVNLGNLAFLAGDAKTALSWFEKAQKTEPEKASVLLGLARANHELENYGTVKDAYEKLKVADAALAARFSYLDLQGADATRAADIAQVTQTVAWDDK